MAQESKTRILHIARYLQQNSDEEHLVTIGQLETYLENLGLSCERKAIGRDLRALQEFGMDLKILRGHGGGCFLASRELDRGELSLLVNAVQSSRFLTQKKCRELTQKLLNFSSFPGQHQIRRQLVISGQVKSMNESIYYNLDAISEAIAEDCPISFRYFDWDLRHTRKFRPGTYLASPYALCLSGENYYLLAHTEKHQVTHYRVDRMQDIVPVKGQKRRPCPQLEDRALQKYEKKTFMMFGGAEKTVRLRMENSLTNTVFDHFGGDAMLIPDGPDHFILTAEVAVSPPFLSWVLSFGKKAEVLYPQEVREQCRKLCETVLSLYQD